MDTDASHLRWSASENGDVHGQIPERFGQMTESDTQETFPAQSSVCEIALHSIHAR